MEGNINPTQNGILQKYRFDTHYKYVATNKISTTKKKAYNKKKKTQNNKNIIKTDCYIEKKKQENC